MDGPQDTTIGYSAILELVSAIDFALGELVEAAAARPADYCGMVVTAKRRKRAKSYLESLKKGNGNFSTGDDRAQLA